MRHLMDVGDQKCVRIQIAVDRDFVAVAEKAVVAKLGAARFGDAQIKGVLLPKPVAVWHGWRGQVFLENLQVGGGLIHSMITRKICEQVLAF